MCLLLPRRFGTPALIYSRMSAHPSYRVPDYSRSSMCHGHPISANARGMGGKLTLPVDFWAVSSELPTNRLEISHLLGRAARAIIAPTHGSNLWHETWPLRNRIAAWRGWHGRSVSRSRHAIGAHGCDQSIERSTG